jgi:hypothetical protein
MNRDLQLYHRLRCKYLANVTSPRSPTGALFTDGRNVVSMSYNVPHVLTAVRTCIRRTFKSHHVQRLGLFSRSDLKYFHHGFRVSHLNVS